MEQASFTKPLALVTGASTGIGYELAKQFAENGFDLVIAAEDSAIAEAATAIGAIGGAHVDYFQVDLSEIDGPAKLYEFVSSLDRPLAAAALNAGAGVGGDFTRETEIEDEIEIIHLNIRSTVILAKMVLKKMLEQGEGRVLFTSSVVGILYAPLQAVYGGTKAFIQSFAESIRNELKDTKISITVLQPGATETDFFDGPGLPETKVAQKKKDDPALVAKQGFKALMAGDDHVVAGSFLNKVEVAIGKVLPESAKAQVTRSYGEKVKPGKNA